MLQRSTSTANRVVIVVAQNGPMPRRFDLPGGQYLAPTIQTTGGGTDLLENFCLTRSRAAAARQSPSH